MRPLGAMIRLLRWLTTAVVMLVLLVAAAFGLLQTSFGRAWLSDTLARAVGAPGFSVSIAGLDGLVPFDFRVSRLTVADDSGTWLALHDVGVELVTADLLRGRVHFRNIAAAAVDVARPPQSQPSATPSAPGLPQLPLPVSVDRIAIDRLALAPALLGQPFTAAVTGNATLAGGAARLRLDVKRLDGDGGDIALRLGVEGKPAVLDVDLSVEAPGDAIYGAGAFVPTPLKITLRGVGPVTRWQGRITASGGSLSVFDGTVALAAKRDVVLSLDGAAAVTPLLPADLGPLVGDRTPVKLRATMAADGTVSLDRFSLDTPSGAVDGTALYRSDGVVAARLTLILPDLARFATRLPMPVAGSARLALTVSGTAAQPALAVKVTGDRLRVGTAVAEQVAVDATVGLGAAADPAAPVDIAAQGSLRGITVPELAALPADQRALDWSLAARLPRDASRVEISRFSANGAGTTVTGQGQFDRAAGRLAATLGAEVPRLQQIAGALGVPLAGKAAAKVEVQGTLDRLQAKATIDGADLATGTAQLDRLHLVAELPDLPALRGTIDAEFAAAELAGTVSLAADAGDPAEWVIPRLRIAAGEATIEGDLRIDRTSGLVRGSIAGRLPDLARLSRLAGMPLAGNLDFKAVLQRKGGQSLDLRLSGDRLAVGAGSDRVAVGRVGATAALTDLRGTPGGKAEVTATAVSLGSGSLDKVSLNVSGTRPGRLGFTAEASGNFGMPVAVQLGGEYEATAQAVELRIGRFTGSLGADRIRLIHTLTLSQRGDGFAFSGLALSLDAGQISGEGALRGSALSLQLTGRNLPVNKLARLGGEPGAAGTLGFEVSLAGTTTAPRGQFSVAARGLSLSAPGQRLPTLGVRANGTWNGRELSLTGRLDGLKGEAFGFSGTVPLVLTAAPLSLSLPPEGRLALRLQGNGNLGNLADLLPLGEDRLTGRFVLDASIGGTLAAPAATGRLSITGGRYYNFTTGAVLTNLRVELVGDRDRFTLRNLAAGDGADGTLGGSGYLILTGPDAPRFDFTVTVKQFRIAARDEATVVASGTATVSGSVAAPKVAARLTVDQADAALPDSLPPSIVRLNVTSINSKRMPHRQARAQEASAAAVALDITVSMPGRVFVRGRGLNSEWRGELKIGGTTAAPTISGSLSSLRGSFDILGKTFRVTQGRIQFLGGTEFDPQLDIQAAVAAAEITAQVRLSGTASSPRISLSSSPVVPQDEILSRVLFNRGLGQISVGEGIQVAQAAASLAGGGPGVLDRLRSTLGLDRLSLGAAPTGTASSNLNPAAGGTATSSTAISGGKYITPGVFVGATQGTTPQSSKVTVEVEITPHISVEADVSRANGNGIGLNYKFDY